MVFGGHESSLSKKQQKLISFTTFMLSFHAMDTRNSLILKNKWMRKEPLGMLRVEDFFFQNKHFKDVITHLWVVKYRKWRFFFSWPNRVVPIRNVFLTRCLVISYTLTFQN